MIKQSTTSGSSYALLGVTPGNGIAFQSDFNASTLGGSYSFPNALAEADPVREHHYRVLVGGRQYLVSGGGGDDLVDRPGDDRPVHHLPQRQRAEHGHVR